MNIFFTLFVATAAVATSYAQSPRQELPPPGGRTNLPFPTHFPTVFNPSNGSEAAAPDYDQLVATGDYYLNQKRYGEAIDHYNKALAQRPEQYPKDQILRAKALQAHEEKEMALRTGEEKKAEAARIPQTEFVPRILENNRWKNAALVCDVTGSMGTYNDQVLNWIAKLLSASDTAVRRVVLFNDKDKRKKIGQDPATAAGLHSFRPVTYEHAKEQVRTAAAESSGGDVYENNITALLRAQLDCPSCEQLIMINDNNRPWDFSRASEVTKPVHIIVCGPPAALEDCYLNLARMTKGSVHFNGRSYTGLETYAEGASLKVDNTTYVVEKGEFVRKH